MVVVACFVNIVVALVAYFVLLCKTMGGIVLAILGCFELIIVVVLLLLFMFF